MIKSIEKILRKYVFGKKKHIFVGGKLGSNYPPEEGLNAYVDYSDAAKMYWDIEKDIDVFISNTINDYNLND